MSARGLRPALAPCEDSPDGGRLAASGLLDADPGLTAIITMNELATFGVVGELQRRRLAIPEDVSVLGVVTSPAVGALCEPRLTTLASPGEQLGRLAVDRLVAQLDPAHGPVPDRLLPCVLSPGLSVAPRPPLAGNGDGSDIRHRNPLPAP